MASPKKQIKKLLFQMRYLEEELKEIQSIYDTARDEFLKEVQQLHYDLNVYDDIFDSIRKSNYSSNQDGDSVDTPQEIEKSPTDNNPSHPPWAKKIFRDIVKDTHPDHFPKNIRDSRRNVLTEIYERTIENYNSKNYSDLLETALRLGIEIGDISNDQITSVKRNISGMQKKIFVIKDSMYWQWAHGDKNLKESILEKFMKMRGWTTKESMRTRSRPGAGNHPGKSITWAKKRFKQIVKSPNDNSEEE